MAFCLQVVGFFIKSVLDLASLARGDQLTLKVKSKWKYGVMRKNFIFLLLFGFLASSLFVSTLHAAPKKIEGPWLWVIAPTDGTGGAAAIDQDTLKAASGGAVTQEGVAKNGVKAGTKVGDHYFMWGTLPPTGGNNVGDLMNENGLNFKAGDIENHDAWAYVEFEAKAAKGVDLHTGSDDAIKVWLNGEVVQSVAQDRGASDFQETIPVDLVDGVNRLLVKCGERGGGWSMFVGIDAVYTVVAVEPADKLATTWATIRNQ